MPALKLTESAAVSVRPLSPAVVSVVSPSVNTWPAVVASVAVPSRVSLPPPVIESESFLPSACRSSESEYWCCPHWPSSERDYCRLRKRSIHCGGNRAADSSISCRDSRCIGREISGNRQSAFCINSRAISTAKLPVFSAPSASAEPMVSSASGAI